MQLFLRLTNSLHNLDNFSLGVISFGLRITCGLYALAYLLHFTAGRFGSLSETLTLLSGVLQTAPAVLVVTVFAALLCDLEMKYRKGNDDT